MAELIGSAIINYANTVLANNTFLHEQAVQESYRALMFGVVGDFVAVERAVTEVVGLSVGGIKSSSRDDKGLLR